MGDAFLSRSKPVLLLIWC